MKKHWMIGALLALFLLLGCAAAQAAEAMDITGECVFRASYPRNPSGNLTDGKYTTKAVVKKAMHPWLSVAAPAGVPIHGLYLCFATMPSGYEIQVDYGQGAGWEKYIDGDTRFYHVYVPLSGVQNVRVYATDDKQVEMAFNEVYAFSEGELPDWVQCWEPTPEKADILFLSTHPDDELIFFGGAIPTYAVEQGRDVVVAYMSYSNTTRRSELLNGLWHMGVRTYPVIGTYRDAFSRKLDAAYKNAGGEAKVVDWVVELYRKYRPEVVVAQDLAGEYGHGMHQMSADAAMKAVEKAATEAECLDSFLTYGQWQVKKLYLHLYPDNQLTFDWTVPLESMDGKTSIELAQEAYALHVTQRTSGMSVTETGAEYDNRVFGLAYSAVGADIRKDDFLENIYEGPASYVPVTPTPAPTPAPTPEPPHLAVMPALNAKGFLDEGEFIYSSEEKGMWIYVNQTCKIIINRRFDDAETLTWFEAEIWGDIQAGERLNAIAYDPEKMGAARVDAAENALKHKVVFAMNADYYTYRVGSHNGRHIGLVIRDGQILYDDPIPENKMTSGMFPNLDMMAFYPDGNMTVCHSWETTAEEFVEQGAYTVLSFGPYLIKDGKLSERAYKSSSSKNPRCALGMMEPGHYVAIMAEGRLKGRSNGITVAHLAQLMRAKGCSVAINLDGGQTAVMCFMGKQLNKIGKYDGGKTSARKTSEVLGIGYSDQVGVYELE